jgi:hypothetical protein
MLPPARGERHESDSHHSGILRTSSDWRRQAVENMWGSSAEPVHKAVPVRSAGQRQLTGRRTHASPGGLGLANLILST